MGTKSEAKNDLREKKGLGWNNKVKKKKMQFCELFSTPLDIREPTAIRV